MSRDDELSERLEPDDAAEGVVEYLAASYREVKSQRDKAQADLVECHTLLRKILAADISCPCCHGDVKHSEEVRDCIEVALRFDAEEELSKE